MPIATRRYVWIVAALVAVAAGAVWLWTLPSNGDGLKVGDYGPDKQHDGAERIVAGLNTFDVEQVPVLQLNGKLSEDQRRSIEAAMPAPGCRYELRVVDDRGREEQQVPDLPSVRSTYRFDATVDEECPGRPTHRRDIGVVAIAEMSYWSPYYFV